MRCKHLARLGRAPANCNHKSLETSPVARNGRSSSGEMQVPNGDKRDRTDRPGHRGWGEGASCVPRVATARRTQARQMWLLARELCTSAALYRVGGRGSTASHELRLAFKVLRDRARIFKTARGRD